MQHATPAHDSEPAIAHLSPAAVEALRRSRAALRARPLEDSALLRMVSDYVEVIEVDIESDRETVVPGAVRPH